VTVGIAHPAAGGDLATTTGTTYTYIAGTPALKSSGDEIRGPAHARRESHRAAVGRKAMTELIPELTPGAAGVEAGSLSSRQAEGVLRLPRWIRALRWIRCAGIPRIDQEARINRDNPGR
jgi:hypothetical protein